MAQHKQFLVLKNAMDCAIDINIMALKLKKTGRRVTINTNNIVSIKLDYTKYDKTNLKYYIITLITGEKIYINEKNAFPMSLFEVIYSENEDYEKVNNFTYTLSKI